MEPTGPVFNPLPAGWREYKNDAIGFRFGYPQEWGELSDYDKNSLMTISLRTDNTYRDDSKNVQGALFFFLSRKDGYTVNAYKYGPIIRPVDNGQEWVVADVNPANIGNNEVGDRGSTPPSVGSGLAGLWSGEFAT